MRHFLGIVLLLVVSLLQDGVCIICHQCDTKTQPKACLDPKGPGKQCQPASTSCIRYVGRTTTGQILVFRECSEERQAPRNCSSTSAADDTKAKGNKIPFCVDICGTDNCNGGSISEANSPIQRAVALPVLGMSLFVFLLVQYCTC